MELYSITICELKFYFEAQISDGQCKHIDKMCKRMQKRAADGMHRRYLFTIFK